MKRFTIQYAAVACVLFAAAAVAVADGWHHGGHHGVGHLHSGFHFGGGLGHILHGHHYGYSHYGFGYHSYPYAYSYPYYTYSYPRYGDAYYYESRPSTYTYYRSGAFCDSPMKYEQSAPSAYLPLALQNRRPQAEPMPSMVSRPPVDVSNGTQRTELSPVVQGNTRTSELGPWLAAPSLRPLIADDEAPWVADEALPDIADPSAEVAASGESASSR